jgi:hypothetical protein
MTDSFEQLSPDELTRRLTYAGLVLIGFEILKGMIVGPVKAFYANVTFGAGMPFKSYEADVRSRARDEFEACLLYLRDFMEAISADDLDTIQELRRHRNDLSHDLVRRLPTLQLEQYREFWNRVDRTLFDLSRYRIRMEIGADPDFKHIDWEADTVKGPEYLLFEHIIEKIKLAL